MDALIREALEKVKADVDRIDWSVSTTHRRENIAKAVHSVDALKSALKAL